MSRASARLPADRERADNHATALALIEQAARQVKFGWVRLEVHDGWVITVDVTNKTRIGM